MTVTTLRKVKMVTHKTAVTQRSNPESVIALRERTYRWKTWTMKLNYHLCRLAKFAAACESIESFCGSDIPLLPPESLSG
jgi:hypothetical protein